MVERVEVVGPLAPGFESILTKEAKAKMVFVDGRLYEPEERSETKKEGQAGEEEQR